MSTAVPTTFVPWIETLIQNTIAQFPSGAWGLGLSPGNLNSMRQILQAYFAVGLGNFGYGIGQQVTPNMAPPPAAGAWFPTPNLGGLAPCGHWRRTPVGQCGPGVGRPGPGQHYRAAVGARGLARGDAHGDGRGPAGQRRTPCRTAVEWDAQRCSDGGQRRSWSRSWTPQRRLRREIRVPARGDPSAASRRVTAYESVRRRPVTVATRTEWQPAPRGVPKVLVAQARSDDLQHDQV